MTLDLKEKCYTRVLGDWNYKEWEIRILREKLDWELKESNSSHVEELQKQKDILEAEQKKNTNSLKLNEIDK